jgi:RNA polymerase sigma factor (TIGR02999 family)
MTSVTQVLKEVEAGEPGAASQLLPLVYDELRRLAAARLAHEAPGQTLDATALVHEAYLRLVPAGMPVAWAGRRHFFAAAAEAMRRILIDNARRKHSLKRGGAGHRLDLDRLALAAPDPTPDPTPDLLDLDEALTRFRAADPQAAELVGLRYFVGLTLREAADVLGIAPRTADAWWAYARAWLTAALQGHEDTPNDDR